MKSFNDHMNSPNDLRNVAGPSRTRLQARQHRNSSSKPYNRKSLATVTDSPARSTHQVDSAISSPTTSFRSAKSRLAGKGKEDQSYTSGSYGAVGLLSGLRQAIFGKPLSWIQAATSATLPSHAQVTAAQRLAASVMGTQVNNDIESHAGTTPSGNKREPPPRASSSNPSHIVPARTIPRISSRLNISAVDTPARSSSPARSNASAAIQSYGRQRMSIGPTPVSPIFGGSNLGTPGYRRGASSRLAEESIINGSVSMGPSQSSPSYAFGYGSERRIAGISSTTSNHNFSLPSPSAIASHNRLPSRSPFAMGGRTSSIAGSVGGIDRSPRVGGMRDLASPSRSRPGSVVGDQFMQRSGSVADSRMSNASGTPKRREWSSLKLAPPRVERSEGEELMQAYQATRNGDSEEFWRNSDNSDVLMMEYGAGPNSLNRTNLFQDSSLLMKRSASMSVDGYDIMSEGTPRKRAKQMVWDADYGFISKDELRAKRPAPPIAHNEAEKLLNALEGMRAPTRGYGANSSGASLRQTMAVPVPLPVSERTVKERDIRQGNMHKISKTVSPYSRALKHRKHLSKATEAQESKTLSEMLKKNVPKRRDEKESSPNAQEDGINEETSEVSMEEDEQEEGSMEKSERSAEESEEDIVEPPRRKMRASGAAPESKVLRSGKVLPPSPPKKSSTIVEARSPEKASKPMSRARLEISASAASAANRERAGQSTTMQHKNSTLTSGASSPALSKSPNGFKILDEFPTEKRAKSSLRQSTDKIHRTHAKSGRIGIDEEDEEEDDEDLPSAEELKKIKLPTNLFPQGFIFSGSTSPSSNGSMTPAREPFATLNDNTSVKALPAPEDDPEKQQNTTIAKETSIQGSSLFSRLGGFAPESKEDKSSEPKAPTLPTFSFTAPSSSSSTSTATTSETLAIASTPAFTFAPVGAKVTAPSSDFFSAPSTASNTGTTPSPSAKHDGPVPNFFASSLAKSASDQGKETMSKVSNITEPAAIARSDQPVFKFGSSSAGSTPAPSSIPTFSSAKDEKSNSAVTGSFSFATNKQSNGDASAPPAFTGFGNTSDDTVSTQKQPVPSFGGFGAPSTSQPSDSTSTSTPTFSFTTPAAASTSTSSPFTGFGENSKKRGADDNDDENRPGKKMNGSMLFSSSSQGPSSAIPAETGFKFSANSNKTSENKSPFTFGQTTPASAPSGVAGSTETKATVPSTPPSGFTFGSGNANIGKSTSMEMMDTSPSSSTIMGGSASTFGTSSAPSAKATFSFGSSNNSSTSSATPSTNQGVFNFGASTANKSNTPTSGPFNFGSGSNGANGETSSNLFGQQSPATSTNIFGNTSNSSLPQTGGFGSTSMAGSNSQLGSSAPFTFGQTSNANNSSSMPTFGNAQGFGQSQAQSMTSTTPSKPAFAFNSPTPTSANTNANAGTSGFSFNMPAAPNSMSGNSGFMSGNNSGSSSPTPFIFGSTANTTPSQGTAPSGNFNFNMGAPSSPQTPAAGAGNLFNLGAAPASGNRPVRGMPSRRKR